MSNSFHFHAILQTDTKKISAVSIFFETMPYRLDESTGYIDYDQVISFSLGGKVFLSSMWMAVIPQKHYHKGLTSYSSHFYHYILRGINLRTVHLV